MQPESIPHRIAVAGIRGAETATNVVRYDLEDLLDDDYHDRQNTKLHLFCQQDRTTLRISKRTAKQIRNLQHPIYRWEHEISYTVSAKRNNDGRANFNLYSYSKKRGLLNLTSRPHLVFGKLMPIAANLLLDEAKRLFEQNIRPWRVPTMATPYPSDALLYNVYPTFFAHTTDFDKRRRLLHTKIPAAALPLLRETSTDTIVAKLFGDNVDPEMYAQFEMGAAPALYTAALLFGKLVPSELYTQINWSRTAASFDLGEVPALHKVLRKCDPPSRARLFHDYVNMTQTGRTLPLQTITQLLQQTGKKYTRDIPYHKLQPITNVHTFEVLQTNLDAQLQVRVAAAAQEQHAVFEAVTREFATLFDTGDANYAFTITEDQICLAYVRRTTTLRVALISKPGKFAPGAKFAARFFGKEAPLPATNALQKKLKNITTYNADVIDHNPTLPIADAINYLRDLAATLRRVARRHQLAPTRANITRLLYCYLYYYNLFPIRNNRQQKLKPPAVPQHMYAYARETDLTAALLLFGLTWDMPVEQVRGYATLPPSVFADFAHIVPKVYPPDALDDF